MGIRLCVSLLAAALLLCLASTSVHAQSAPKSHRKAVVMVEPEYPTVLKMGHFEGQVRLDATVLPNGNVVKIDVKGGNPMLCEYAAKAVMKWKYAPAPAQTVEEVIFNFNPNNP